MVATSFTGNTSDQLLCGTQWSKMHPGDQHMVVFIQGAQLAACRPYAACEGLNGRPPDSWQVSPHHIVLAATVAGVSGLPFLLQLFLPVPTPEWRAAWQPGEQRGSLECMVQQGVLQSRNAAAVHNVAGREAHRCSKELWAWSALEGSVSMLCSNGCGGPGVCVA